MFGFFYCCNAGIFASLNSTYSLSKTSFIKGLQCHKALFLYKHYPQLRDPIPPARQALFNRGHDVGALAHQLFPGGVDASVGLTGAAIAAKTQELIAAGVEIIYEAGFIYDDVLVLADIVVKTAEGWNVYEIKSSLRLSRTYYNDAVLQHYVIAGSGLVVNDFFLVHVNPDYVRNGALNVQEYFQKVSVTGTVKKYVALIRKQVRELKAVLDAPQIPEVAIGEHCFSPYECDFKGTCWKNIVTDNVFTLTGIGRNKQAEFFNQGYVSIKDLPENVELPKAAHLQWQGFVTEQEVVRTAEITAMLEQIGNHALLLDVENFQPAIPQYEGCKPFQALPFAYSLHEWKDGNIIKHRVFLAEPGMDPRESFLREFLSDCSTELPVVVFDASAERVTINNMIRTFPEVASQLEAISARIVDLQKVFASGAYYHPRMKGSYSLKSVLPAIAPDLNYDSLTVQNGSHAMQLYSRLQTETDLFELATGREQLLQYCETDTLGMVRILNYLHDLLRR